MCSQRSGNEWELGLQANGGNPNKGKTIYWMLNLSEIDMKTQTLARIKLHGGPYDEQITPLQNGTVVFKVTHQGKRWHGHYNRHGFWVPAGEEPVQK
jgi:hypothetical protein